MSPLDDHGIRERIIQAGVDASNAWLKRAPFRSDPLEDAVALAAARAALLAVRAQISKGDNEWTQEISPGYARGRRESVEVLDTLLASLDPQETKEEQNDQGAGLAAVGNDTTVVPTPQLPHDDPAQRVLMQIDALLAAQSAAHRPCEWSLDDVGEDSVWETSCGHAFEFTTDGPTENHAKFCCYCGQPLVERRTSAEESHESE